MEREARIQNECPYDKSGFLSRWCFTWMFPLFRVGSDKDLDLGDLYQCSREDDPYVAVTKLEREWEVELKKCKLHNQTPSLAAAIWRAFRRTFWIYFFLAIFAEIALKLTQPFMVGQLVEYLSCTEMDKDCATFHKALASAIGIVVTSIIYTFLSNHAFVLLMRNGNNARTASTVLLYKKLLKLNTSSLGVTNVGQMLNIMANDLNRFEDVGFLFGYVVAAPFYALIALAGAFYYLGWSFLGGFITLGVLLPIQSAMGKLFQNIRSKTTSITDQRVETMSEVVSSMKLIKVYCWEHPFSYLINQIRKREVGNSRKTYMMEGFNYSLYYINIKMMLFTSFVTHVLLGHKLDEKLVFTVMSLFNAIRLTVTETFPYGVGATAEALVSCDRITKILMLDEYQPSTMNHNSNLKVGSILMKGFNAKWTKRCLNNSLVNMNLAVDPGQCVVVVGSVGSGKTCLLYSLLNEIHQVSGSLQLNGHLSYAPQESFCFNGTIRENILMGNDYDEDRYEEVIHVCSLKRDMKLFADGEDTLIGEKGYTLSGGQKARISLARAVYNSANIYLLDDPLSAVDPKVANQIFDRCIRGVLRNKTVILVTHQLQFLKQADKVVVMEAGAITAQGSCHQLMESDNLFLSFIKERESQMKQVEENLRKQRSMSISTSNRYATESTPTVSSLGSNVTNGSSTSSNRDEKATYGSVGGDIYWDYLKSGGSFSLIFFGLLFSLMSQGLYNFSDLWLSAWTGYMKEGNDSLALAHRFIQRDGPNKTTDLMFNIYSYSGQISLLFLTTLIRLFLIYTLCLKCSINLHDTIFKKLLRAPMRFFESNPLGRIMNRFTRDLAIVDQLIPRTFVEVNFGLLDILGNIMVAVAISPYLLIPCTILVFFIVPLRNYFVRTTRDLHRLDAVARSPVYGHVTTSFDGIVTLRSFRRQGTFEGQFLRYMRDSVSCRFTVLYGGRLFALMMDVFTNCYIFCICVVIMATPTGVIPAGDAGVILSSSLLLSVYLQFTVRRTAILENQMTSCQRVLEYGKLESEADLNVPGSVPDDKWPQQGQVIFKNVHLRYSADLPYVLKDVSFEVQPGEKVGVVGRTGAGKSSLISVLFRLVEPEGQIIIDGVNSKSLGLHDLREKISIIPQDPSLFSGTVRKNLDPFNEYNDEEIWKCLEASDMDTSVRAHEGGLDGVITTGGSNFSLGQRQLLCLARALLKDNRILVLDEATANVDLTTDELIQKTIETKFVNYTVITVAHRLNTIIDMDKVMVMDGGRVVEFDAPHLLLQDPDGVFYSMVRQTGHEFEQMLHKEAERSFLKKRGSLIDI